METYTLKSPSGTKPPYMRRGQETLLYDVLKELGGVRLEFGAIVKQCHHRHYEALLKSETLADFVAWYLGNWLKRKIVVRDFA